MFFHALRATIRNVRRRLVHQVWQRREEAARRGNNEDVLEDPLATLDGRRPRGCDVMLKTAGTAVARLLVRTR